MSTAKKVPLGKTKAIGKIVSFSVIFGPILMRFFAKCTWKTGAASECSKNFRDARLK